MKQKAIVLAAAMALFAVAPAALAAPPGNWSFSATSVQASFDLGSGSLSIGADNYSDNFEGETFEGSGAWLDYFEESETGFTYCFGWAEVGPNIDARLSNGSLEATFDGTCSVEEFGEEPPGEEGEFVAAHEENGGGGGIEVPLTASVSLTWDGTGLVLRSSGHSTGPGDVCKYNDASRQATATGSIELTAGEVLDVNLASAVSEDASLFHYESSCHAKGSPGAG
ncbi:MAG TPA: hypothetical protein VEB69_15365 [Acidimicrobiia bacterium]|nr:hypothetical protein [Acidimicrobiia bacterium]